MQCFVSFRVFGLSLMINSLVRIASIDYFESEHGKKVKGEFTYFEAEVKSVLQCTYKCVMDDGCMSASYNNGQGLCHLSYHRINGSADQERLIVESSWMAMFKGKPSKDPAHPDYLPTIFKHGKTTEKEKQTKLRRYNSSTKRKIRFDSPIPKKRPALESKENENIPETLIATKVQLYVPNENLEPPVTPLQREISPFERELFYTEMDNLRTERDQIKQENEMLQCTITKMKLNSKSVEENDEKCKFFTGLKWSIFIQTFNFLVSFLKPTPLSRKVPFQEQFFLTLVKLRLDLPFELISMNANISTSMASDLFWTWINLMNSKLDFLIKWPDRETIKRTLPGPFRSKFPNLTSIIDCFELLIERPKKISARNKCYSNYKKHSTVKVLIACTPNGAISFLSKAWGGRVSDVERVRQSGFIDPKFHLPNDQILADRGFTLKEEFATVCSAQLIIPAFTKGKKQLSAQEVEISRKINSVRIHIERVIGLMKCRFKILQGTLPIPVIKSLNDEADGVDMARIDKLLRACAICVNLGDSIVYKE